MPAPVMRGAHGSPPTAVLNAAAADMYANRYTRAEREYESALAASPRDTTALASFALFLNYAGDQARARVEAQLAVQADQDSGLARAVECRVDDWSARFADAVTAGREATRLSPREALAHLFLAEALADTGRLTESASEISAAGVLVREHASPFLRAELLREQGNLAGDRGDDAGRRASFGAASAQQPGWLYRTAEVVDAMVGAGDTEAAVRLLEGAAGRAPDDPLVLRTLGQEALSTGDASLALDVWSRAAALAPRDPDILDGLGAVTVAAKADVNGAVAAFESALRADPRDLEAAGYLLALARYVQHDPAAGTREIAQAVAGAGPARGAAAVAPPDPDAAQAADAERALGDVNAARGAAGLPPVHLDGRLSASARSHSYYWLFNNLSSTVSGLGIHMETPGLRGYSGQTPGARALAFGYPNARVGEDIDHRGGPVAAVDEWVNSVFHRFPIVRPDLVAVGYGEARAGPLLIEDLEFSFALPQAAQPVVYPGAGQPRVPAFFVDNELPDPVPVGKPRATGSPVTVTFGAGVSVRVTSFSLSDSGGRTLAAYSAVPSESDENSAWLLPVQPLDPGSVYTARITAVVDGRPFARAWSFTTSG
jgi:tetratricopeptide (TPR) repeat protein